MAGRPSFKGFSAKQVSSEILESYLGSCPLRLLVIVAVCKVCGSN